ncbi:MAG TPA: amino acid transporter, partial [Acetomicrobium sp.]|nr:amino acid transporter [Acetomicrobium sp.]
ALITIPLLYLLTLKDISSLVNFGALTSFALMHVALAYRLVKVEHKPLSIVMPIIGFCITAVVWYGLDVLAKSVGIVWIIVGVIYLAFITRGFKVKTILPVD